jgi:hypothetical protein
LFAEKRINGIILPKLSLLSKIFQNIHFFILCNTKQTITTTIHYNIYLFKNKKIALSSTIVILPFFHDHVDDNNNNHKSTNSMYDDYCYGNNNNNNNPGAYTLSKECEYCGSKDIANCNKTICQRPQLYFQKKVHHL